MFHTPTLSFGGYKIKYTINIVYKFQQHILKGLGHLSELKKKKIKIRITEKKV